MSIFQEEERKVSGEKQYTAEVFIPAGIYDRVNWLLDFDGDMTIMSDEEMADADMEQDVYEEIFSVTFDDGVSLSYVLLSGSSNYYDDVEVTYPDGRCVSAYNEPGYSLDDIEFEDENGITRYVIVHRSEETKKIYCVKKEGLTDGISPSISEGRIVETTWDAIKRNPNTIATGDLIPFTLKNGEAVAVRAMHDGTGKLFFVLENCLGEKHHMNPTHTAKGDWKDCEMRKWLNETVFALLPDDLQKAIVPTEVEGVSNGTIQPTTRDKLFLLAYWDVFGDDYYSIPPLDWFEDESHRIKLNNDGKASRWWLRDNFDCSSFFVVGIDGREDPNDDADNLAGVVFGFSLAE